MANNQNFFDKINVGPNSIVSLVGRKMFFKKLYISHQLKINPEKVLRFPPSHWDEET